MQGVAIAEAAFRRPAYARKKQAGAYHHHPDAPHAASGARQDPGRARTCYATVRRRCGKRREIVTPLAKAWCTELGVEAASLACKCMAAWASSKAGAAQFYRDARIAPIYEGTNGIQAIDLYGRKLMSDRGEAMRALIAEAHTASDKALYLKDAAQALDNATDYMLSAAREDGLAGAFEYLMLAGDVAAGTLLAQGLARHDAKDKRALMEIYDAFVLARARNGD